MEGRGRLRGLGKLSSGRRALFAIAALCSFFAIGAAPALAAKVVVGTIGGESAGSLGGEFNGPRGIAVNQTGNGAPAGTFYVVDGGNNRIQQFGPTGNFIRTWGIGVKTEEPEFEICSVAASCTRGSALSGAVAGALNVPVGMAVSPSTGLVYVSNQSNRRIDIYSPTGVYQGGFGWGVRTGAAQLQFCTTLTGCQAPAAAAPTTGSIGAGQFGTQIGGLAAAANGDIYVADKSNRRVQVFRPLFSDGVVTGVDFLRAFGWGAATGAAEFEVCTTATCNAPAAAGTGLGQFATNSPTEIALDSQGDLFAVDAGNKRVQKISSTPAPLTATFGSAGLTSAFETGTLVSVAVEPETDNVMVAGRRSTEENRVAIVELDGTGAAVEAFGTELLPTAAFSVAVASPSLGGNVYLTSNNNGQRVYILNETLPTVEAPTGITAHGATFNGQVVSNGLEVAYHFEYSTDGVSWIKVPAADASAGPAPGSIPVSQVASGLLPDTPYRVRLVADRPAGGGTTTSGEVPFSTSTSKPTIEETLASQVGAVDATLAAYLNPEKAATTYYFEYGPTASYGSVAPIVPASAGTGTARVSVSAAIGQLASSSTYHFRVVAENANGVTVGPDSTFTTLPAAIPSPQRAYEMVSPPDKHGSNVIIPGNENYNGYDFTPISSVDGRSVAFTSFGTFAGAQSHGVFTPYLASRSTNGWSTESLSIPMRGAGNGIAFVEMFGFSPDLKSRAFRGTKSPQLVPGASEWVANDYVWNGSAQRYELMTPGLPSKVEVYTNGVAYSHDMSRVFLTLSNAGQLTPDTPVGLYSNTYEWNAETGQLSYIGIEPESTTPFSVPVLVASPYGNAGQIHPQPAIWNPVSVEGDRAFFETVEAANQLYVRIDGTSTQHLSKSVRSVPDPNGQQASVFRWASGDGEVAFFTSGEKLTEDATTGPASSGADLYRYQVDTEELIDITVDGTDPNGAEVKGVLGGSEDGKRVYFVAGGVLAPGGVAGADNLYLWTDDGSPKGDIDFISVGVGVENWFGTSDSLQRPFGRVTPSGEHVLFQTTTKLSQFDNDGKRQVYVYDAEADRLQCASCNPTGAVARYDSEGFGGGGVLQLSRLITDDGRLAFFTTREALVPEDVNGLRDAYAFDTGKGQVSLVSPGTGPNPAEFLDASADGGDIFFGTRERLVGIDTDDNIDVYDSRVGGGIGAQNPPLVTPCAGEACRPASTPPPAASTPPSTSPSGPGNHKEARKKKPQKKKGKKGKKTKSGKNGKRGKTRSKHRSNEQGKG